MTVAELIAKLQEMPQDATVYAEGEPANKVICEDVGNVVRIFKAWDIEFVSMIDCGEDCDNDCEHCDYATCPKEENKND